MPLKIIRQDITSIRCDAVVNPTDSRYSHGGGLDEAIHEAAGAELYHACVAQGWLAEGEAKMTSGFALPCRFVIHTVGPVWRGGECGEEAMLRACYRACLQLVDAHGFESVAFPLISSGTFGFPKDRVLKIAVDEISDFLLTHDTRVYLVVYDKTTYAISAKLFADVTSFLGDTYVPPVDATTSYCRRIPKGALGSMCVSREKKSEALPPVGGASLEDMLRNMDKGFAETLFHYIDEKGLTDVECYKRANVDKKTFSKIKCNPNYKPSKVTAVSFAIALRLNLEETRHLLNTVGLSLSRSSTFDVIIEFFITTGQYADIFEVNETLYQFDQVTLGV